MPPTNRMRPIHPGEILAEELAELALSADDLDRILAVPPGTVAGILAERRSIDADFALRLDRYLGSGARLWMNLQVSYDLKQTGQEMGTKIRHQVQPRQDTPSYALAADAPGDYALAVDAAG